VQPRADRSLTAGENDLHQPMPDHDTERKEEDEIEIEEAKHPLGFGAELHRSREDDISDEAGDGRRKSQHHR